MKIVNIPKLSNSTLDFSVELENKILTLQTNIGGIEIDVNLDKLKVLNDVVSRAIKHHMDLGKYSDGTSIQIGDKVAVDYSKTVMCYYIDYSGMWGYDKSLILELKHIKYFVDNINKSKTKNIYKL